MRVSPHTTIERGAWRLAVVGLLPFVWCVLEALAGSAVLGIAPSMMQLWYGAAILSFLGGMYWMRGLVLQGNANLSLWLMGMSTLPALCGWAACLAAASGEMPLSTLLMLGGFAGLLKAEHSFTQMELIPQWFWRLRLRITSAVLCLMAITALAG